tara:strand:+ start:923 stop:1141 length:219 start_codon:yes stop_codon:yes gene_type:complete
VHNFVDFHTFNNINLVSFEIASFKFGFASVNVFHAIVVDSVPVLGIFLLKEQNASIAQVKRSDVILHCDAIF